MKKKGRWIPVIGCLMLVLFSGRLWKNDRYSKYGRAGDSQSESNCGRGVTAWQRVYVAYRKFGIHPTGTVQRKRLFFTV